MKGSCSAKVFITNVWVFNGQINIFSKLIPNINKSPNVAINPTEPITIGKLGNNMIFAKIESHVNFPKQYKLIGKVTTEITIDEIKDFAKNPSLR